MSISVILLSHNVKDLLKKAIESVYKTYNDKDLELVVVDNASIDGSVQMVQKSFSKAKLVISKENLGFAKGNNLAKKVATGNIILFLNADTIVKDNTINKCLEILNNSPQISAITCKVMLPNGKMDYSCHRGLPTVWNTFCYWTGLTKLFPKSKVFSGYTATYLSTTESHYIDCISGTFLMIRKEVLDKVGWLDEDYFWNGEDIELCYQLKKYGYKIWYESSVTMTHYKGSSSGLWSTAAVKVSDDNKKIYAKSAASAMRIFINKHSSELGSYPVMLLVKLGIYLLEKYRIWKIDRGYKYA